MPTTAAEAVTTSLKGRQLSGKQVTFIVEVPITSVKLVHDVERRSSYIK